MNNYTTEDKFLQLGKTYQFKLRRLFKNNFLALALWVSGDSDFQQLGFNNRREAALYLSHQVGTYCTFTTKQMFALLEISPLVEGLNLGTIIEESKPLVLSEAAKNIVLALCSDSNGLTVAKIRDITGQERSNVYHSLALLEKQGVVEKVMVRASRKDKRLACYKLLLSNYSVLTYITYILSCISKSRPNLLPQSDTFDPKIVELANQQRININWDTVEDYWKIIDMETMITMNTISPQTEIPVRFYTKAELQAKPEPQVKTYNIAEFCNDIFDTNFETGYAAEFYRLKCPFHHGENTNFYLWNDGHYRCFRCDVSGSWLPGLVMDIENCELEEALEVTEQYSSYTPLSQVEGGQTDASSHAHDSELAIKDGENMYAGVYTVEKLRPNWNNLSPASCYLFGRGFTTQTLDHFKVHDFSHIDDTYPVWFPLFQNKEVYGYQKRAVWAGITPKYLSGKGTRKADYLYGEFRQGSIPLLVEGVTDCWRAWQNGYKDVCAMLGASLSDMQVLALVQKGVNIVMVATDNDEAGSAAYEQVRHKLANAGIQAIRFMYQGKDIGMLNKVVFQAALKQVLKQAKLL